MSQGVLANTLPVLNIVSQVFSAHFITHSLMTGATFCAAFPQTKFDSSSTPIPIFSRFLFCSGDCDSYHFLSTSIFGDATLETSDLNDSGSADIHSCTVCPTNQEIGDVTACTNHVHHLNSLPTDCIAHHLSTISSKDHIGTSVSSFHASHIRFIPPLKASPVFSIAQDINHCSSGCFLL